MDLQTCLFDIEQKEPALKLSMHVLPTSMCELVLRNLCILAAGVPCALFAALYSLARFLFRLGGDIDDDAAAVISAVIAHAMPHMPGAAIRARREPRLTQAVVTPALAGLIPRLSHPDGHYWGVYA